MVIISIVIGVLMVTVDGDMTVLFVTVHILVVWGDTTVRVVGLTV